MFYSCGYETTKGHRGCSFWANSEKEMKKIEKFYKLSSYHPSRGTEPFEWRPAKILEKCGIGSALLHNFVYLDYMAIRAGLKTGAQSLEDDGAVHTIAHAMHLQTGVYDFDIVKDILWYEKNLIGFPPDEIVLPFSSPSGELNPWLVELLKSQRNF